MKRLIYALLVTLSLLLQTPTPAQDGIESVVTEKVPIRGQEPYKNLALELVALPSKRSSATQRGTTTRERVKKHREETKKHFDKLRERHTPHDNVNGSLVGNLFQEKSGANAKTRTAQEQQTDSDAGSAFKEKKTRYDEITGERLKCKTDGNKGLNLRMVRDYDDETDGTLDHREVSTVAYDEDCNLIERSFHSDLDVDGVIDRREFHYSDTYTYDRRGNLVRHVSDFAGSYIARTVFQASYDAKDRLVEEDYETDNNMDGTIDQRSRSFYTYDARGNLVSMVSEFKDGNGRRDYQSTVKYFYDEQDRRVRGTGDYDDGADGTIDAQALLNISYDDTLNVVRLVLEWDDPFDGVMDSREMTSTTYDSRGEVVRFEWSIDYDGDGVNEFHTIENVSYDRRGEVVRYETAVDWDGDGVTDNHSIGTNTYDDKGRLIRVTDDLKSPDFKFSQVGTLSYDVRGNLVRYAEEVDSESEDSVDGIDSRRVITWVYDNKNQQLQSVEDTEDFYPNHPPFRNRDTLTWEYDGKGNVVRTVDESDAEINGVINSRLTVVADYNERGRVLRAVEDHEDYFNDGRLYGTYRVTYTYQY
ncbi:MAG TPA: hypothetical protein VFX97_15735 [Pyrinomonadaceae bacterium]|nr:hypothetical protein [Pyrinomonadaceae bacterium]